MSPLEAASYERKARLSTTSLAQSVVTMCSMMSRVAEVEDEGEDEEDLASWALMVPKRPRNAR